MLKYITVIFILFSFNITFAQEGLVKSYYDNGKLKSEINFSNNVREGDAKFYYENGNIEEERNYNNGKVEGLVKRYNKDGKLEEVFNIENGRRQGPASLFDSAGVYLSDVNFENGVKVTDIPEEDEEAASSSKQEKNNTPENKTARTSVRKNSASSYLPPVEAEEDNKSNDDPAYYLTAEVMPEPIGGFDALQKRLFYPSLARQKKIEGTVKVQTFINKYGDVTKADVIQGIGYGCDESARTTVFYSRFKPGLIKGKPVNVQMVISLKFQLEN
ncbi:MAG: TonB family protein [Ignavibacteriaceae bacterium]